MTISEIVGMLLSLYSILSCDAETGHRSAKEAPGKGLNNYRFVIPENAGIRLKGVQSQEIQRTGPRLSPGRQILQCFPKGIVQIIRQCEVEKVTHGLQIELHGNRCSNVRMRVVAFEGEILEAESKEVFDFRVEAHRR